MSRNVADKALIGSASAVAVTTAIFPFVTGYGTVLFQIVVLSAWAIVARATSGKFADLHHEVVWPVALVLNLICFFLIAAPLWGIFRKRQPKLAAALVVGWSVIYIALLFVLVPATDGP